MSKIQDALKKIQSSKPGREVRASAAERYDEDDTVATLVLSEELVKSEGHKTHRSLVVDRDRLRDEGLLAPENQERAIADQYRLIKRPLLENVGSDLSDANLDAHLIMVASALPGDGKSFNAINLALSIAIERDTSVILVDADVAKPHISGLFGAREAPGLLDLIRDESMNFYDALLDTDVEGLMVLPAGQRDEHATELIASRRMAELVSKLRSEYPNHIVIFDSSPILATSEAQVLANLMGQIAFVVCAGKTPQHAVADALDSLDNSKAINLVLNQATGRSGRGAYGYGYGHYYGSE